MSPSLKVRPAMIGICIACIIVAVIIAKGTDLHPLRALMNGGAHTLFAASESRAQARKRVVLKITPERVASWDHRKLGGTY